MNPGKAGARDRARTALRNLSPLQRRNEEGGLMAALRAWEALRSTTWVLAYLPLDDEPDLTPFLTWWLKRGRLALPRSRPDRSLDFAEVTSLEGPWRTVGRLREPPAAAPIWPGGLGVALVPGLAFAPAPHGAYRLGRGGGYYDRWLPSHRGVTSIGVGYAIQTWEAVPVDPHDAALTGWWDGTELRGFTGAGR